MTTRPRSCMEPTPSPPVLSPCKNATQIHPWPLRLASVTTLGSQALVFCSQIHHNFPIRSVLCVSEEVLDSSMADFINDGDILLLTEMTII